MIEIIPAIDILDGKCVRLSQGDYNHRTIYNENPLEVAKAFEDHGIRRLHLVDLDGAKAHRIINHRVLHKIASQTSLRIDFGGGLKTAADLLVAFDNGAEMLTGGSIAVKNPEIFEQWIHDFGPEKIILGADCKDRKIAVQGWTESTGLDVFAFIRDWRKKGILQTICTDINKDGMLNGPSIKLYREIREDDPSLHLIASGGVTSLQDIKDLEAAGIPAVILGKAIYEGTVSLKDLSRFNENNPVT
jgi:phosphoribosylformimino-5-aminoimidazole carboxamide ribotide isomerase